MNKRTLTDFIKNSAAELGFDDCGIARSGFLKEQAPLLESWLNKNYHGKMSYLENYFDIRLDPSKLVDGAKSVIVLVSNYYPDEELPTEDNFKIARYAYGRDYHKVLRKKLKRLLNKIKEKSGDISGRVFVDSAPLLERTWAVKAGLGWQGKNTLLLNKRKGSYYFLSEIVVDLELAYDHPETDHCGTCTACMDSCPTDAFPEPYVLDASKCISYLTIELKESIPQEFNDKMNNWIFGCDICQEVCPWNKFSKPNKTVEFTPREELKKMNKGDWLDISEDTFNEIFQGSALKRTGYNGLLRNMKMAD